jgi:glutamate N-acetyltransferase/amino-acid N-acetyltransferase
VPRQGGVGRLARVPGFRASGIACGIKPSRALDLALIVSDRPATAAGVFTRSRVPGAPVIVSRRRVARGRACAVVVNSGISNVATGAAGVRDAEAMTARVAQRLGLEARDVLVSSTGVIGPPLPMQKIARGIPRAVAALSPTGWSLAARAILTTDTRPKLARTRGRSFRMLGIAKGAGMVRPDMATMLAYVVTDLAVAPRLLRATLREVVEETFNRLSIDGQMSTSDCVLVLANGAAGNPPLAQGSRGASGFRSALRDVATDLVEQLAADGEGVTRLADVRVSGARDDREALRTARAIADSVLFKTALFGGDPNWGRVVQAVGAAAVRLDPQRLAVRIAGVDLLRRGTPVKDPKARARAARGMRRRRVPVEVTLGSGRGAARVLTTDLSYEYVRINAEYTT